MRHYLKSSSSYIVVVLRSLRHRACVCCGKPLSSFDESADHWEKELNKTKQEIGSYFGYKKEVIKK